MKLAGILSTLAAIAVLLFPFAEESEQPVSKSISSFLSQPIIPVQSERVAILDGRLTYPEDGLPIRNAEILCRSLNTNWSARTKTDNEGRYKIFNVPVGKVAIIATNIDPHPASRGLFAEARIEIEVIPTKVRETQTTEVNHAQTGTHIRIETGMVAGSSMKYFPPETPTPVPSPAISPSPGLHPLDPSWLREARKKFAQGKIAFKPPEEMTAGKTETLEARITLQKDTIEKILEGMKGSGKPTVEKLQVGNTMKVSLIARNENFSIISINNDERHLDPNEPFISWKWDVTPQLPGTHDIHLVAQAMVEIPGMGKQTLYDKTFDYAIRVNVTRETAIDWALRHWKEILGGLVTLVGAGWVVFTYIRQTGARGFGVPKGVKGRRRMK